MINIEKRPGCIKSTLQIVGDKWSPLILNELTKRTSTFTELEHLLVKISPRTLSQRLEMLVSEGIIIKHEYCEHPPRFEYSLTKKGHELRKVLKAMSDWGGKYYSQLEA